MRKIFFHADIDGIISAALYMCASKTKTDYALFPLFSSARGGKFKNMIKANAFDGDEVIILDFEYNDRANLWIDHHRSEMFRRSVDNKKIRFDEDAASAASIVMKWAVEIHGYDNPIASSVVALTDMIDGAKYPSVEFIFSNDDPLMMIRAHLETSFPSDMMYCRIVEVIANCNMDVRAAIKTLRIDYTGLNKLKSHITDVKSHVVKFDNITVLKQKYPYQFARYVENVAMPKTAYNIRISNSLEKGVVYFQVSHNKWCGKKNNTNLGAYIGSHRLMIKGGGHFNVASGMVKSSNVDELLDDVSSILSEDSMEKYAVDKEDKVEKKAEELVKTAAVKTIEEGREIAAKEEDAPIKE